MRPSSHRSDIELIIASRHGDLSAFETLVERYQRVILLYIGRYVEDTPLAEDILQETFIAGYRAITRIEDPGKFGYWLRKIARNRCLNHFRARRRAITAHQIWKEMQDDAGKTTGDAQRKGPDLSDMVARLTPLNARIVLMRYEDEWSLSAIAERLGLSKDQVKDRLYRSHRLIQKEVMAMMKDDTLKNRMPAGLSGRVIAGIVEESRKAWLHMRYDEAQKRLQDALDLAPDDPDALLAFGNAYDPVAGAQPAHLDALERAARQAPDSIPVQCAYASALWQSGRAQEYEETWQRCLMLCENRLSDQPADIEALRHKAELFRIREDHTGAEHPLRQGLAVAPDDQALTYFLGLSLSRQNRMDEAMPYYERAYELHTETVWAYFALRQMATYAAYQTDDARRAVALMENVWALTGRANEADNLIYFCSGTGQLDQAIDLYESVKLSHLTARSRAAVGLGYLQRGSFDAARKELEAAIGQSSEAAFKAEVSWHLAVTLFTLGYNEEAKRAIETGLSLTPETRSSMLSGSPASIFRQPWTTWLIDAMDRLRLHDGRIAGLRKEIATRFEMEKNRVFDKTTPVLTRP